MATFPDQPAIDSQALGDQAGTPGPILTGSDATGKISGAGPDVNLDLSGQFVNTAYNLVAYPSLRPQLILDQFATVRATKQTHRGASVRFSFVDDLAPATTPLYENLDVDSQSFGAKGLVVAMNEYGNAVTQTALLRGTSMIPIDPLVADRVGYNAGQSIDTIAGEALFSGNYDYDGLSAGNGGILFDDGEKEYVDVVDSLNALTSESLRKAVLKLQKNNARPMNGSYWTLIASPDQVMQLRGEALAGSNQSGWRDVTMRNEGTAGSSIYYGQVGTYEGVNIIANNHLPSNDKAVLLGAEAFAKVYSTAPGFGPTPNTVVSPVVDKLRRFASVGWHHLVGYSIFRPESMVYINTSNSAAPTPPPPTP